MFVAPRGLGLELAEIEGLQGEHTDLVGGVLGDERLVADDVEVADQELHAARALPRAALGLRDFEAALHALVEKGRVDDVGVGQFLMLVVGIAITGGQLFQKAVAEIEVEAGIDARLPDVEMDEFAVARRQVVARRHAINIVVMADREAAAAVVVDQREAGGDVVGLRCRIGQRAAHIGERLRGWVRTGEGLGAGARRQQEAADVEVVALRIAAVGVCDDLGINRHIDDRAAVPLVRRRAVGAEQIDVREFVGHGARDACVDDVDDAADRRRAVE